MKWLVAFQQTTKQTTFVVTGALRVKSDSENFMHKLHSTSFFLCVTILFKY